MSEPTMKEMADVAWAEHLREFHDPGADRFSFGQGFVRGYHAALDRHAAKLAQQRPFIAVDCQK